VATQPLTGNSLNEVASPHRRHKVWDYTDNVCDYSRDRGLKERGYSAAETSTGMSALGHKRTLRRVRLMSALPPKADIGSAHRDVR
jgi:hypothetical protein